jgi:ESCRT-II complex subunit VPS36
VRLSHFGSPASMELLSEGVTLTGSGLPTFEPDEVETTRHGAVHIYSEDHATKSAAGVALVTTSRIIWIAGTTAGAVRLEHLAAAEADGGGFFGLANSAKILLAVAPQGGEQRRFKLAFHGGGRDECLERINAARAAKSWVKYVEPEKVRGLEGGMAGVRSGKQTEEKMASQTMTGAFGDLDGLMAKAKEMVSLASSIAQSAAAAGRDSAASGELESIMASAGIDNPVTKSVAGSSYHMDLARQLSDFLAEPLQKSHGVMTLTDVYCLYNAARGIEMVSPLDLRKACLMFESLRLPLRIRNLKSGVTVVESGLASEAEVDVRMKAVVAERGNVSVDELANLSGMSLYIAKEQLEGAESRGVVARDESAIQGVRYYANIFMEE